MARVRIPGDRPSGGGPRQAITGFSKRSRRALLDLVNSIDQRVILALCVRLVTLTFPGVFPGPRQAKALLKVMRERFRRDYPGVPFLWKLEPQERGAPHFHLLAFMPPGSEVAAEVEWWAANWYQVVGSGDPRHLAWHRGELGNGNRPCVEQIRTWHGVSTYASKYMGKPVDGSAWDRPGRWWGKHDAQHLPITLHTHELDPRTAAILKRAVRRWYEHQPSGRYLLAVDESRPTRHHLTPGQLHKLRDQVRDNLGGELHARPYHRRWKHSRGGISVYLADQAFARLLAWATAEGFRPAEDLDNEGTDDDERRHAPGLQRPVPAAGDPGGGSLFALRSDLQQLGHQVGPSANPVGLPDLQVRRGRLRN